VDSNNRAFFLNNLVNRWLGVRLEWLGSLVLLSVALIISIMAGSVDVGLAGLALSYALALTGQLNWVSLLVCLQFERHLCLLAYHL
jgi:hypothetical protein